MLYPSNFEEKVGFDRVRSLIKDECKSVLAKDYVDDIKFITDSEVVLDSLGEVEDFMLLMLEFASEFPIFEVTDLREPFGRTKAEGSHLDSQDFYVIKNSLVNYVALTQFLKSKSEERFHHIARLVESFVDSSLFSTIIDSISRVINKYGEVADNASPELFDIRKKIIQTQNDARKTLVSILNQAQSSGIVEKDAVPSLREGRLVIPVSAMNKRQIKGIIHDESASGKTFFIEPASVVNLNNRVRELENDERREVLRILIDLTSSIRPYYDLIVDIIYQVAYIDFVAAKAKLAHSMRAIKPESVDCPFIDWNNARHPILERKLQKQNRKIVPLSIALNQDKRLLIISGPNAGGKSVCLKTVGLVQYMFQCGCLVPVDETSRLGFFDKIFIDIGDDQSIDNDLSTYSSHISNMKFSIKNSDSKTLLLIDEFGSGTEPQIGGAIAESILHKFNENRSFGVITTHYNNLKLYASNNEGVVNGAMLYDRHLMQPLFALQIGNPGSSFAVEIARKIGLSEDIISYAIDKVGQNQVDLDKFVQDIARDKRYWERKRESILEKEKRLEKVVASYEAKEELLDEQRKAFIKKAKEEASQLLSKTNAQIENAIREIRESKADKDIVKIVREQVDSLKKEVAKEEKTKERPVKKQQQVAKTPEEPLKVGHNVRQKGGSVIGEILEIKGNQATVAFGNIHTKTALNKLEKASRAEVRTQNRSTSNIVDKVRDKSLNFNNNLDIRGYRVDEGVIAVNEYLDTAIMIGRSPLRILHGTGTGALKQAVRDYIKGQPFVKSYRDENIQLGGAGITVVELKL